MRRLISEVVCAVVQSIPEAAFDVVDYLQVLIEVTSPFFGRGKPKISVCSKVSCLTVISMSIMHYLFLVIGQYFEPGAVLLFELLRRKEVSFDIHISSLPVAGFRPAFLRLPMRYFVAPKVNCSRLICNNF